MVLDSIVGYLLSFVAGGGLLTLVTLRSSKKKADVEVRVDEIKALHDTIDMVYQPMINQLNGRVHELEGEVKSLREQLNSERADHKKEIDMMHKQIIAITSVLGIKAEEKIRDEKGRFVKVEENED